MKQWSIRLGLLGALALMAWWLWGVFFPPPQRVIRKHLAELARAASFSAGDGAYAKGANCQRILSLCAPDVEIILDMPGASQTFSGQDELREAILGVQGLSKGLHVEFLGISVSVEADGTSAIASLTAKAKVAGEKDYTVQELKFTFRKIGGDWLIRKVETVKTLSHLQAAPPRLEARLVAGVAAAFGCLPWVWRPGLSPRG